jgi:hypothetical protein
MIKQTMIFLGMFLISLSTEAITIYPGDSLRMDYDFSSYSSTAPWTRTPGAVVLADNTFNADIWDQYTSVELSIYDSSDVFLGSETYTNTSSIVPSNMSNAIEFTTPTTDPLGYVVLNSIDAQFDFLGIQLTLQNPSIGQTPYQTLIPTAVPLPGALILLSTGIIGLLGLLTRSKKA